MKLKQFSMRPALVATAVFLTFSSVVTASAQQVGHYLQGVTGLENGSTAPPGLYVGYLPYIEMINSFKDASGNTLLNTDINVVAHNAVYSVTTAKKILGATYGIGVIIPIVNTRVVANTFDTTVQEAGVSDIFFEPVVLGWEKGKVNYTLNYGFYAPTGNFNPSAALNQGLGFWEHQIEAGATYNIDKKKLWNTSLLSTWEINQSKSGLDVKAGPMATFEYSLGHRFFKYAMNAGAAGYAYTKLSPDSGSGVGRLAQGGSRSLFRYRSGVEVHRREISRRL